MGVGEKSFAVAWHIGCVRIRIMLNARAEIPPTPPILVPLELLKAIQASLITRPRSHDRT